MQLAGLADDQELAVALSEHVQQQAGGLWGGDAVGAEGGIELAFGGIARWRCGRSDGFWRRNDHRNGR